MHSRLYILRLSQSTLRRASISTPLSFQVTCPPFRSIHQKCLYTTKVERKIEESAGWQSAQNVQNDTKQRFIAPSKALKKFLEHSNAGARSAYWGLVRHNLNWGALNSIILQRLNNTELSSLQQRRLARHNFTVEDVDAWCKILLEDNADTRVHLYLCTSANMPMALLLQICRGNILKVYTLKSLLDHVWDLVNNPPTTTNMAQSFRIRKCPPPAIDIGESVSGEARDVIGFSSPTMTGAIEESAFSKLIFRLLRLCQDIWPEAMITVAQMVPIYIDQLHVKSTSNSQTSSLKFYRRMCKLQSAVLQALATPARARPYDNMVHNWAAQKVILDYSTRFTPSLVLDQSAYQAVVQVLGSMRKIPAEIKSSARRARSWPPWRIELDGMDATRDPEEDKSRVVKALEAKREAGYSDTPYDQVMSILGGQESDGTPTVQSRVVNKLWRRMRLGDPSQDTSLNCHVWAARIWSTRDVQEAWSAFAQFLEQGGAPNIEVYRVMLQKLIFERERVGSQKADDVGSGDGLEVLPVVDDNISDFYKSRLKPPSIEELYEDMMRRKVRPSGRLLSLLIRHAVSVERALGYLRDAGVEEDILEILVCRQPPSEAEMGVLMRLFQSSDTIRVLTDFIHLLCRFAPRAVQVPTDSPDRVQYLESSDLDYKWIIRSVYNYSGPEELHLQQAIWLLSSWQPSHRPPWYVLLKLLAQPNTVINTAKFGDPIQYQTAWEMTATILKKFRDIGLELDADGFQLVCYSFTRFATIASQVPDMTAAVADAKQIIKDEVRNLAHVLEDSEILPKFMYPVHPAALHAYIRAMGSANDHREIILTLRWMRTHDEDLMKVAARGKRGLNLLHRCLVAIRVACEGASDSYRGAAVRYMTKEGSQWIRWPSDEDVDEYWRNYQPTYLEDHLNAKLQQDDGSAMETEEILDIDVEVEHDELRTNAA